MQVGYYSVVNVIYAAPDCGVYAFICLLFGAGLLRCVRIYPSKDTPSGAGYLGGAFFLGQGIFGALWQVIATLGFFNLSVVGVILAFAGFLGVFQLLSIVRLALDHVKSVVKDTWNSGFAWVVVALLLIVLIAALACLTLSPPNGDALSYYVVQEKLIAQTHHLKHVFGWAALGHFGLNAEMHGAVMYLMGGDVVGEYAANMTVWVTAGAGAVMLWAISFQVGLARLGQWTVMLMLFTSTAFLFVMWGGKTDLFGVGLGLAAIYWVLQIGKFPDWVALVFSGLMAGFSINCKMSFIVVMIPMLVLLAALLLSKEFTSKEENKGSAWTAMFLYLIKAAFIAGGSVFVTFLPLVFKNTVVLNEPLAPFIYLHMAGNAVLDQTWYSPEASMWIALTCPLALTFGQYPMQGGNLSALWLAFFPALLFFPKYLGAFQNKLLAYLTLSSFFGVAFWVVVLPATLAPRYFLPPLLTVLPLGGFIVEQLWRQRGRLMLRFVMYLAMGAMLLITVDGIKPFFDYSKLWYVTRGKLWEAFALVNNKAKKGDRVFLATYYRSLLRPDLLQSFILMSDESTVWDSVYRMGGRWIILDRQAYSTTYPRLANLEGIPDFLSIVSYPMDDRYMVYQIIPKEGAPKSMKISVEQKDGTWKVQDLTN